MKLRLLAFCIALAGKVCHGAWPEPSAEMRPWIYNWWMGSAVTEAGLREQTETLKKAGFGGFHVIPIYGLADKTKNVRFLSDEWADRFASAVRLAHEKGLGVDLSGGPGFTFGGPEISAEDGFWTLKVQGAGDGVRAGHTNLWQGTDASGTPLRLVAAPSRRRLKRASHEDAGLMINPFVPESMKLHLKALASVFDARKELRPRAFYHDSYDYHEAAWSPRLADDFRRRRGYALEEHFAALAGQGDADEIARVKHDYRQTLSEQMVETFGTWTEWCRARGMRTRYQAHGSPADWLALYALADSPETEICGGWRGKEAVTKFASSAAHIAGRKLVSSETGTWLGNHFNVRLCDLKRLCDTLFLSGVNHVFYHGFCYSPPDEPWPGRTFYAATEMNPRNPIWRDVPALNAYVTRCQSILQTCRTDNDLLVYWPLHDWWQRADGLAFEAEMSVGNAKLWFSGGTIGPAADFLWRNGCCFDYVSDALLERALASGRYKAVFVPQCRAMPPEVAKRLAAFSHAGGKVCFEGKLPDDVPGLPDVQARRAALSEALATGRFAVGSRERLMDGLEVRRLPWVRAGGLSGLRLCDGKGRKVWFVVNRGRRFEGALELPVKHGKLAAMWPWSGDVFDLPCDGGRVRIALESGESVFLSEEPSGVAAPRVADGMVRTMPVAGRWTLTPVCGGPAMPRRTMDCPVSWSDNPDGSENPFCGTVRYETVFDLQGGMSGSRGGVLDAGEVHESARVRLNGRDLGVRVMPPFRWNVPGGVLRKSGNRLSIEVTNLGANRIRDMDRRGVQWKDVATDTVFAQNYKRLDASGWKLLPSGLSGPVSLSVIDR